MLTIFSIPKPFHNNITVIQENAIQSWKNIHPECEIYLFGDEDGVEEYAKKYCISHIKEVPRNEFGTPILSDVFEKIQKLANNNFICFVNTDIILIPDIINAVLLVKNLPEFLMVGRRTNIECHMRIDMSYNANKDILAYIEREGTPGRPDQIDCFIFPKGQIKKMPPFAVGRAGWDNWLIADTRRRKIPVIDGSSAFHVIHQNHDYGHIKVRTNNSWEGPETDRNRELMGGLKNLYNIDDASWILTNNGLKRKIPGLGDIYRNIWRSLK